MGFKKGMNVVGVRVTLLGEWESFGDKWEFYLHIDSKHIKDMQEEQSPKLLGSSRDYFNEILTKVLSQRTVNRLSFAQEKEIFDKVYNAMIDLKNASLPKVSPQDAYYGV